MREDILNTDIYCLTSEKHSNNRSNIKVVEQMIAAGIEIIQYREKEKDMRVKYNECQKIKKMTARAGVDLIINDHVDLALLVDADGIHLGQKDLPVTEVKKLVGEDMIIGLSTHSPQQAQAAVKKDVDYIGVGPIFETSTKKDVCDPVGFEYLEFVVENINIPFVTIGGIKEHNVEMVNKRGANCIAMITEIVGADNIQEKIKNIRKKIN